MAGLCLPKSHSIMAFIPVAAAPQLGQPEGSVPLVWMRIFTILVRKMLWETQVVMRFPASIQRMFKRLVLCSLSDGCLAYSPSENTQNCRTVSESHISISQCLCWFVKNKHPVYLCKKNKKFLITATNDLNCVLTVLITAKETRQRWPPSSL